LTDTVDVVKKLAGELREPFSLVLNNREKAR